MDIRTGFGYDIHRLVEGDGILLAGVKIPCSLKEDAHSDGDVLYHSLSNALLSSIGLDDIGIYFPDNSASTLGMDSSEIVKFALSKVKEKGYHLSNAVVDILLEKPKLKDYKPEIKRHIAEILGLDIDRVSLMANTGEKVDAVGRNEAVVVYCNVLIEKVED